MKYAFRIRALLSPGVRLGVPQVTPGDSDASSFSTSSGWELRALPKGTSLPAATEFDIHRGGFSTSDEARTEGDRLVVALRVALTQKSLAIDLGDYKPQGHVTPLGLAHFAPAGAGQTLNSRVGLCVYEDRPQTVFIGIGPARDTASFPVDKLMELVEENFATGLTVTKRESLALELLHAADFESGARARFLLIVAGLESLLEPKPRSELARKLVEDMSTQAKVSGLPKAEIDSICGTLRWLHCDSITRTGRDLAAALLPTRTYQGLSAEKFFLQLYRTRSNLVHSGTTGLPPDSFLVFSGQAHLFVRDLILASIMARAAG